VAVLGGFDAESNAADYSAYRQTASFEGVPPE